MMDDEEEVPPRRIALTGIAGYMGRELASALDVDLGTEHVLGIDVAPYVPPSPKVFFVQRSVVEPFGDLLAEHRIDAAVHLAFCTTPTRDRAHEERLNIEGTKSFLAACSQAKVKTVVVLSDALAYGAHPENLTNVLYEGAPLRASPDFPYAHDKVRVEDLCYEFAKKNPDTCLQIVRPCLVVGPNMDNVLSRWLDKPLLVVPGGYDPPLQVIHEDDATRSLFRLLKMRKVGVFNLAADGAITLGRIAQLAGRRLVRLPRFAVRGLFGMAWRLGWSRVSEVPPGVLDYFKFPCLISNVKVKTELLFLFKYDATRAIEDFLEARDERQGRGRRTEELPIDLDDDDLDELEAIDNELEAAGDFGKNPLGPGGEPPAPEAPSVAAAAAAPPVAAAPAPPLEPASAARPASPNGAAPAAVVEKTPTASDMPPAGPPPA